MAASRLLFAMARGGDAPPLLAQTLAGRKTPAAAILLVEAVGLAATLVGVSGLAGWPLGRGAAKGLGAAVLGAAAFLAANQVFAVF